MNNKDLLGSYSTTVILDSSAKRSRRHDSEDCFGKRRRDVPVFETAYLFLPSHRRSISNIGFLTDTGLSHVSHAKWNVDEQKTIDAVVKLMKYGSDDSYFSDFEREMIFENEQKMHKAINDHPLHKQHRIISDFLDSGSIHDCFHLGNGRQGGLHYLVTERIKGNELNHFIYDSPACFNDKLDIFRLIAFKLKLFHDAGFIHRDIKPGNIMVKDDYDPVLIDTGFATPIGEVLFDIGAAVGTPHYIAPENIHEGISYPVPQTDIFSFGVVMYQAVEGKMPFGEGKKSIAEIGKDIVGLRLRDMQTSDSGNSGIRKVIYTCLAPPSIRYSSMDEVLNDLDKCRYVD